MTTTLRLSRTGGSWAINRSHPWQIVIDGTVVGSIVKRETVEVAVEPGGHTVRVNASERFRSRERSFDAADEQMVSFRCHGPLLWPMMVAALIKPDLWISLRQD